MIATLLAASALFTSTQPWQVNQSESQCRLSRVYVSERNSIKLSLADVLGGSSAMTLNLFVPATSDQAREDGVADISFEPTNIIQRPTYFSTVAPGEGTRVVQTTIAVAPEMRLPGVTTLRVKTGNVDVTLAPGITEKALIAFKTCADDLRAKLGLAADEASLIAEPALGPPKPEDWVSSADYPMKALRERSEGTVVAVLTVGTDGRVSECRPAISSGTALLDETTCTLLTRRGRFRPAIGKDGRLRASHYVWQTDWQLPQP